MSFVANHFRHTGVSFGWDEGRVERVLAYYTAQSEEEAVAEDEAAFDKPGQTFIKVPTELVPAVRELIAKHTSV